MSEEKESGPEVGLVLSDALARYLGFTQLGEEASLRDNFEGYEQAARRRNQAQRRFSAAEWQYLLDRAEDEADRAYFRLRLSEGRRA